MARRKKVSWGAQAIPSLRRASVETGERAIVDASRDVAFALKIADLFWVTEPMTRAAMDASHDNPTLSAVDIPTVAGLMAFEKPLPPWTYANPDARMIHAMLGADGAPIDAILWHQRGDFIDVVAMTRANRLMPGSRGLVPVGVIPTPLPVDLNDPPAGMEPAMVALLAFLGAAMVMMMQPTVAHRRTLDVRTGRTGPLVERAPQLHEVTVVDLRPLRHVADDDRRTEGTGRTLRTRHLVRGHWTHQPYGRNREHRRLQWVNSYIRGPEGAPWSGGREMVYAWRR